LPLLATIFASCKFILLAASIAYLVAGLTTFGLQRARH
jgi:hypothetical protein